MRLGTEYDDCYLTTAAKGPCIIIKDIEASGYGKRERNKENICGKKGKEGLFAREDEIRDIVA